MALLPHPVAVGLDGSEASLLALDWAAAESVRLGRPLHVVLVHDGLSQVVSRDRIGRDRGERDRLDRLMATAYERLMPTAAEDFLVNVVGGPPVPALLEAARDASMLVLGRRRTSRLVGGWGLTGSVSAGVLRHARCPVVVMRPPRDPSSRTLLVGLDGLGSQGALSFGLEMASRHQLSVLALARRDPRTTDLLAGCGERYPGVVLSCQPVTGNALATFTEASRHAHLAVVGPSGRVWSAHGWPRQASTRLVERAQCPVAITRMPDGLAVAAPTQRVVP